MAVLLAVVTLGASREVIKSTAGGREKLLPPSVKLSRSDPIRGHLLLPVPNCLCYEALPSLGSRRIAILLLRSLAQ